MDMACAMLFHAPAVYIEFCAEAVYTACFIRKRLVTKSCKTESTTFEMIHRRKPNLKCFTVFGSKAFLHKLEKKIQGIFDFKAPEGVLVGYCKGSAYRVWLPEEKWILETKEVCIVQELL